MDEATVPEARCHPVLKRHELRKVRLPVGAGMVSVVVPEPGEWLRAGIGGSFAARSDRWEPPYWLQIWPSGVGIAQVLGTLELRDVRLLDLGCGLGIPGIAAASRGARVTFADCSADALEFAVWNADRVAGRAVASAQRVDWSIGGIDGHFDLILLSDVSYRSVHHEPLRRQVCSSLLPGGAVLHADPCRPEATPFVEWLERAFRTVAGTREVKHAGRRQAVRFRLAVDPQHYPGRWGPLVARIARSALGSRAS